MKKVFKKLIPVTLALLLASCGVPSKKEKKALDEAIAGAFATEVQNLNCYPDKMREYGEFPNLSVNEVLELKKSFDSSLAFIKKKWNYTTKEASYVDPDGVKSVIIIEDEGAIFLMNQTMFLFYFTKASCFYAEASEIMINNQPGNELFIADAYIFSDKLYTTALGLYKSEKMYFKNDSLCAQDDCFFIKKMQKEVNKDFKRKFVDAFRTVNSRGKTLVQLNKAIKEVPAYYQLYIDRGAIKDENNDYYGALLDYNKAVKIAPYEWGGYEYRGLVKWSLEDYYGAIADIEKSNSLLEKSAKKGGSVPRPRNYYNLGLLKEQVGESYEACKEARKAIAAAYTSHSTKTYDIQTNTYNIDTVDYPVDKALMKNIKSLVARNCGK